MLPKPKVMNGHSTMMMLLLLTTAALSLGIARASGMDEYESLVDCLYYSEQFYNLGE